MSAAPTEVLLDHGSRTSRHASAQCDLHAERTGVHLRQADETRTRARSATEDQPLHKAGKRRVFRSGRRPLRRSFVTTTRRCSSTRSGRTPTATLRWRRTRSASAWNLRRGDHDILRANPISRGQTIMPRSAGTTRYRWSPSRTRHRSRWKRCGRRCRTWRWRWAEANQVPIDLAAITGLAAQAASPVGRVILRLDPSWSETINIYAPSPIESGTDVLHPEGDGPPPVRRAV